MKYQDYYSSLGVDRKASKEQIQKAFRSLARRYHPDVNKDAGAEDKFKEINEAYDVLGDPKKREAYDQLGSNWKAGQEFQPPPNWEELFGGSFRRSGTHSGFSAEGINSFSDFFQQAFGGMGAQTFSMNSGPGGANPFGSQGGAMRSARGQDIEADLSITLSEAFAGGRKKISFDVIQTHPDGKRSKEKKSYSVKIPAGTSSGATIRLAGQGGVGRNGGAQGDLLLRVKVLDDSRFKLEGSDVYSNVPISPWEASFGAKVSVDTLDGKISLTIPAGAQSDQKLRIRERGFPTKNGKRGNFYAVLKITMPKELSEREAELLNKLAEESDFNPREGN